MGKGKDSCHKHYREGKYGNCVVCGKKFIKRTCQHKYCSPSCVRESSKNQYYNSTLNHLSTTKIGCISELEVCAHYIREGYEVFRNVSLNGPADLIIWKPETGELHLIDVKSHVKTTSPESYIKTLEKRSNFDIKIVPYDYNTKQILRDLSNDLDL